MGKNEEIHTVIEKTTTLTCDVKNEGPKSTIKWLFVSWSTNGGEDKTTKFTEWKGRTPGIGANHAEFEEAHHFEYPN